MAIGKGLEPDCIPVQLLQAGASPLAIRMSELRGRIVCAESWPPGWTGGRLVELFKGKGDMLSCDAHRGLLIGDHMAKAVIGILKEELEPFSVANMPTSQFGAVPGGGTDYANHIVLSMLDLAARLSLSICILFVDFVKAFHKVLLDLVFGFPPDVLPEDRIRYFASLGLHADKAAWVVSYLADQGCAFDQWRWTPKLRGL